MPMNAPHFLQARASEVRAAVMAELPPLPVTLAFEAYVGRKPVLTVTTTSPSGASTSRDFDFQPLDELHTQRLVNSIVRIAQERYLGGDNPAPSPAIEE